MNSIQGNKINRFYQGLMVYAIVTFVALMLSGCIISKEGVNIGDFASPEEVLDSSPVLGDTTSAVMMDRQLTPKELALNVLYQDHLYEMRQQTFYYPRKGGGTYAIRYYEGNVIYAAIIGPENYTLEDIVFFKEKWYYNQRRITEEITKSQAMIFVESILNFISKEEMEGTAEAVGN